MVEFLWEGLKGFKRQDGRYGVRNLVVVMAAADNVNPLVAALVERVPGSVGIPATFGRGQLGYDFDVTLKTMGALANHPNVFGSLVVSFEPHSASRIVELAGDNCIQLSLLETGGFANALDKGAEILSAFMEQASRETKVIIPPEKLTLGLECGGSDTTSGLITNPLLGAISDSLIAAGGSAVFSEPIELIGCEQVLSDRARSEQVANQIVSSIEHYRKVALDAGVDLLGVNPTADNIAGGLSTIEEKSIGAVAKSGTAKIEGVLGYGDKPMERGLWLMDAPAAAVENITALTASGCQLILFSTGTVNPIGSALAPTVKVCGNAEYAKLMSEHVDVDVSKVLSGQLSFSDAFDVATEMIRSLFDGEMCASERLNYVETRISRFGQSV